MNIINREKDADHIRITTNVAISINFCKQKSCSINRIEKIQQIAEF